MKTAWPPPEKSKKCVQLKLHTGLFHVLHIHVFSLGLFQRALCPLGALMCPLAPPLDQHIFNSYLNYLSLKVSVVKV